MISIPGYKTLEQLYESNSTIIFKGQKEGEQTPVMIKLLKKDYPTPEEIKAFQYEYNLTKDLSSRINGVIKNYDLLNYKNSLAIIMEDIGGTSLNHYTEKERFSLKTFLQVALKIAKILNDLHKSNTIHKDIKPHNIIINNKGELRLIDFSQSTKLSKEIQEIKNPENLEGTLAYIAPEQTGRMNRSIDYRTDFYSLGVTFYELLTSKLPFDYNDPMELVHAHIARMPVPPHEINPGIPKVVSKIIMKLMAKNAEDRYQSAYGLMVDIEKCYKQLKDKNIIEDFEIAQFDMSNKFQIPEKLYGREKELTHLMEIYKRITDGQKEMVFFSGEPGIGKTVLIREIHKPIIENRGYFIDGKFEQFKKNIPYSAIIQAFKGLSKQLLTENDSKIQLWKDEILEAVGSLGKVITDVIPQIELIIGKQGEVEELTAAESQNRFNMVFQAFVKVFATKEHPLILFLDDMQWADNASLDLIKMLYSDVELKYFLFIGTYRSNEIDKSHPFEVMRDSLKNTGHECEEITVSYLTKLSVQELISETLQTEPGKIDELTNIVMQKTNGNPFFVNEFLKSLYENEFITFDNGWKLDMDKIKGAKITDNVVELLADKIKKLPEKTWNIMKIASCIGVKFYNDTLTTVSGKEEEKVLDDLLNAINEGMILKFKDHCRFVHDRVREAAYSLIKQNEIKGLHYKIGKALLEATPENELEEKIFPIVNQLNLAVDFLNEQEKEKLIKLNLAAGIKAKTNAAYDAAIEFLKINIEKLLSEDSWKKQYEITFDIYYNYAEALYMAGKKELLEEIFAIMSKKVKNLIDEAKMTYLQIQYYSALKEMQKTLGIGIKVLKKMKINIPRKPALPFILMKILNNKSLIKKIGGIDKINKLPELKDSIKIMSLKIMSRLCITAFVEDPLLFGYLHLTSAELSLKFGTTEYSTPGLMILGLFHAGALNDPKTALEIARQSILIADKYNSDYFRAWIAAIECFIGFWNYDLKKGLENFAKGIKYGFEASNYEDLSTCLNFYSWHCVFSGKNIKTILGDKDRLDQETLLYYHSLVKKINHEQNIYFYPWLQTAHSLVNNPKSNPKQLNGPYYNENDENNQNEIASNPSFKMHITIINLFFDLIYSDYDKIPGYIKDEKLVSDNSLSMITYPQYCFYMGIGLSLNTYKNPDDKNKTAALLQKYIKKMDTWSSNCPDNFSHQAALLKAEYARLQNDHLEAQKQYEEAIKLAKKYKFLQNEAIANECAAKYYYNVNLIEPGRNYINNAVYSYEKWGCTLKSEMLAKEYSGLLVLNNENTADFNQTLKATVRSSSRSSTSSAQMLDINTVMKAGQAISGEIEMAKLLEKMIKIVIENAGAQKGILILKNDNNELLIEAQSNVNTNEFNILESNPVDKASNLSPAIIRYAAKTKEVIILNNAVNEGQFTGDSYIKQNKPKSILCSPIIKQGKLIGIIYLENNVSTAAFTEKRVEMVKMLSSQAAISIENAKLINNLKEQERLKQEMEIAEKIQTSLCPEPPEHPELDITAVMQPAEEVGGDYYDIVYDKNNNLWFAIGDVTGHGVTSGLVMMMAETLFNAQVKLTDNPDPASVFNKVNWILYENVKERMGEKQLMTMNFLKYEGKGKFSHAGAHMDIIVWRNKKREFELVKTKGVFLSMLKDTSDLTVNLDFILEKDDIMILYTDGITEAADKNENMLDPEGLQDIAVKVIDQPLEVIRDRIIKESLEWCDYKQADDMTMIIVKMKY